MKTRDVIKTITFRVDSANTICDYLAISRTLRRHKELSGWLFKNTDCPAEMREQSLTKQEVPKWCTNAVRPQPKGNAAVMMLP